MNKLKTAYQTNKIQQGFEDFNGKHKWKQQQFSFSKLMKFNQS